MANSLGGLTPELWSNRIQKWLRKSAVFMAIANLEEKAAISVGDTVHRPYISDFQVNDYTKGTAVSIQDITATDETLTIATTKEISFYVDTIDKIQNMYNSADERSQRAAYRLSNDIDGDFLSQVENATNDFDDGDIGGTAGNPIALTSSNTVKSFSLLKAMMNKNNIEGDKPWDVVMDPATASFIEQQVVANGFNTADLTLKNGYAGDFLGFNCFVSNNLLHETILTAAGTIVADNTITVAGVTFTIKAAPSVAGEVDLGASDEISLTNIALAINAGAGAGSEYIEISAANRQTLTNNRVTATSTATTLTIKSSGYVAVVEVLTGVTAATTSVKMLAERRGAIDMVIQKLPTAQINKVEDKLGHNFITYDLYGIKTFQEGKDRMIEFNVTSQ